MALSFLSTKVTQKAGDEITERGDIGTIVFQPTRRHRKIIEAIVLYASHQHFLASAFLMTLVMAVPLSTAMKDQRLQLTNTESVYLKARILTI